MQPEPLDIVALMVAVIAFIASKDVASVAGPYAAIAIMACAGSSLSLSGIEERIGPWRGAWFIFVRVFIAVAVTVFMAELIEKVMPYLKPRYTLAPIAFAVGWVRDFNDVRSWFGKLIDKWVNKRIEDGK